MAVKTGQGSGYLFRPHRQRGIAAIAHQPLEFDAHSFRRPRLEADTVDLSLRLGLGEPRPLGHDYNIT